MRILLAGSTGLVGQQVLAQLLTDDRVDQVVAPTRRPLESRHDKLENPLIDYEALPESAAWWTVDAVICTLGTTIKKVGSKTAFHRVDHDYPLLVARHAQAAGASTYALCSASGANPASRFFYNRVKGELERDLEALAFPSLALVRPGLIGGEREEHRAGEAFAARLLGVLHPVLPRALRICPAERIAAALVNAAVDGQPGTRVVPAAALSR